MIKTEELTNPNSCLSKALEGEMLFTLLARDALAPEIIRHWVKRRIEEGKNFEGDQQTREALNCANIMQAQREGGMFKNTHRN